MKYKEHDVCVNPMFLFAQDHRYYLKKKGFQVVQKQ
jgi:hypothetical protein